MIHILKGGCGTRHPSSYRMSRPEGVPNYVLLIVKTPGEFMINNNFYLVSPGNAIILAPFTSSFYGNPKGDYIDDWLHFELADDSIFDRNEIPKNTFLLVTQGTLLYDKYCGRNLYSSQFVSKILRLCFLFLSITFPSLVVILITKI